jgi:hypothetical protein
MPPSDPSSPSDPGVVDEAAAAQLWRRAAELQEEDLRRAEEADRASAFQRALAGDGSGTASLSLAEIKAAADSAGIPSEYVELAWIERSYGSDGGAADSRRERARRRFLGTDLRVLEVSRTYDAPLESVIEAMARIFPQVPFGLRLEATERISAAGTEVFVFAVPGQFDGGLSNPFGGFAAAMAWADLKKLIVSVRSTGESGDSTEVSIRSPLGYSRKLNYGLGLGISSGIALAGGAIGVLGAGALLAGAIAAGAALAPLGIAVGGLSGVGAGRMLTERGWRRLYAVALKKSREGIEQLLSAITLHLRTDGAFLPGGTQQGPGTAEFAPGPRLRP